MCSTRGKLKSKQRIKSNSLSVYQRKQNQTHCILHESLFRSSFASAEVVVGNDCRATLVALTHQWHSLLVRVLVQEPAGPPKLIEWCQAKHKVIARRQEQHRPLLKHALRKHNDAAGVVVVVRDHVVVARTNNPPMLDVPEYLKSVASQQVPKNGVNLEPPTRNVYIEFFG